MQKFSSYKEITLKILKREGIIYFVYYIPFHTVKKKSITITQIAFYQIRPLAPLRMLFFTSGPTGL